MSPLPYSLKRGDTKYPIEAGTMFRLKEKRILMNFKSKTRIEHEIFMWIQKHYKPHKERLRHQRRKVRLWTCKMPILTQYFHCHILTEQAISIDTVMRSMQRHGYEVLKTGLPFYHRNRFDTRCYHIPYVIAGLITETDIGKKS